MKASTSGTSNNASASNNASGSGNNHKTAVAKPSRSVYTEHREICARFEESEATVRALVAELRDKREALRALEGGSDWEATLRLKDETLDLKRRIKALREGNDEIEYYKTAGPLLFRYFNTFEQIDATAVPPEGAKAENKKSILSFLTKKPSSSSGAAGTQQPSGAASSGAAAASPDDVSGDNRGTLYEKYMEVVNRNYVKTYPDDDVDVCPHCASRNRHVVVSEGVAHCSNCLTAERILMEVDRPSYRDPPTEITYFAYRRSNHFSEWLAQVQGREYTDIPNEVIDAILVEINKEKITNMASLTNAKVRQILRTLRYHKFYEHSNFILHKISGVPPPQLGEDIEEKLRQMFDAVQGPFLKHAPKGRTNFLSYAYVLRKFLEMLGKTEFLHHFPLQKSRDKVWMCEVTWKKICEELNWPFIRSI